ncbi:MAG: hypothetical protein JO316_15690 [Abitibacteriaceae bacterium]|nr:hypothetical protein [Abditibacteriaceae bacterium]
MDIVAWGFALLWLVAAGVVALHQSRGRKRVARQRNITEHSVTVEVD